MVRPGTVAAVAAAVMALAIIALLMGVFATMPADAGTVRSCGHLLDAAYRHGHPPTGCSGPLHQRRIEVAVATAFAGAAALVGVGAASRMVRASR
ncbi:MAG: hypothetical protein ACYDH6_22140 [Acidimicrobiales bacterium]